MAIIRSVILEKQDDEDAGSKISDDESEDPGESTLSSAIEEDDLAH